MLRAGRDRRESHSPVLVPGRASGVGLLAQPIRSWSGASGADFVDFPASFACCAAGGGEGAGNTRASIPK